MLKSLKQLINEYERLTKAKLINDTHYPDEVDIAHKTPHPEKPWLIAKFGKDKKPTWTYNERTAKDYEDNLQKLLNGERVLDHDKKTLLPNNLKTLTPENIELLKDHVTNLLMKDPDKHAISANTDPTKPEDHMEVRVRHVVNALTGRDGYELRNTPTGGFEIYAPRHSQSSKAQDIATHWFFHPTKKRFRSKRIYPQGVQKSLKALTTKYKELQKSLKYFKNMPKRDIVGGDYGKPTNEPRRNEEVGSGPRLRKTDRGSRADLVSGEDRRLGKTDRGSRANEFGQSKPSHHDVDKSLSMGKKTEENVLNNYGLKKSVTRGTGSVLSTGRSLRDGNERAAQSASLEKSASEIASSNRNKMGRSISNKTQEQLKKAEDEAGMTAYPLKDGYSIHHETSQNGYDIWSIGHGGQRAGTFMICTDETRRGRPFVSWAGVDKPHRGKGVGAAVYKTLAAHYGGLDSDRNSTSVDALKAWRRAGGKQLKSKTQFGDYRYTLDGDKKRPPIVWNEDLIKGFKSQWGGTLPDTDNSHVVRNEWWHGTPSGRFPLNNIHVGSKRAAHEALTATIGHPVEGEWDGTREYGKTLLAGKKTLEARGIPITGYSVDAPLEDHYPTGKAKYSDGTQVSSSEKPNMLRFKIKGKMTSHPHTPRTDMAANAIMKRKGIKQGIYYVNEGEDPGSISAVVPSVEHLEQVIDKKKNEDLEKTRGTLTFPKVLPKDTRPEENVKQIPKDEKAHSMHGGLYEVQPAKQQFMETALKDVPGTRKYMQAQNIERQLGSGLAGAHFPKAKRSFAFSSEPWAKAHEAIHAIVGKAAEHFNVDEKAVYEHLNSLIHPEDKEILSHTLRTNGYPLDVHHAEMIPWIHTILHNKTARAHFLNSVKMFKDNVDEDKGRKSIQRLGRTWNAILKTGKELDKLP